MAENRVLVAIDALPSLSPHAIELLDLQIEDADAESHLLHVVNGEPPLAAKLIGAANSAAFGLSRVRFGTVPLAIRRIGLRRSIQLCTAALVGQPLEVGLRPEQRMHLWRHALTTAVVAAELARRQGIDPGKAYLAGLLHDIGYMFAELREPGVLARLEALAIDQETTIDLLEASVLGCGHGEITGELLTYWKLPRALVELFRDHHRLPPSPASLASVVATAEHFARLADVTEAFPGDLGSLFAGIAPDPEALAAEVGALFEIDGAEFERMLRRVQAQVAEIAGLAAAMSTPARPPDGGAHPPSGRVSRSDGRAVQ
ncbi:MAG: HDOD domain-containing protein [Rhodocyclaceae bacterium]|nr:HDOD domain-containing protein [Rhodocyclaceae bacterium]